MVGIVSYSTYIPQKRIKTSDIAYANGKGSEVEQSLGISKKPVVAIDEDSVTMAVEAAHKAIKAGNISPDHIEAILVGSESHPYAVKPTSTIVGELIGTGNNYMACDLEFACKAGTAAIQLVCGLIESGKISFGLAIGSDVAQGKPGDVLEYTAASGAAAFVLGNRNSIADIIDFTSYSSDTPDFWRRDGEAYPSHAGRFTKEPAYFAHVMGASKKLLTKTQLKPADFKYAIFHMPNGKFPLEVARRLGFTNEQLKEGYTVKDLGNSYTATTLIALAKVLDIAQPGEKIFLCSYGSGAGSDAFVFEVTKNYED